MVATAVIIHCEIDQMSVIEPRATLLKSRVVGVMIEQPALLDGLKQ